LAKQHFVEEVVHRCRQSLFNSGHYDCIERKGAHAPDAIDKSVLFMAVRVGRSSPCRERLPTNFASDATEH